MTSSERKPEKKVKMSSYKDLVPTALRAFNPTTSIAAMLEVQIWKIKVPGLIWFIE